MRREQLRSSFIIICIKPSDKACIKVCSVCQNSLELRNICNASTYSKISLFSGREISSIGSLHSQEMTDCFSLSQFTLLFSRQQRNLNKKVLLLMSILAEYRFS